MTEFSLRDNLDSNDILEFVVVRGDIEYGRWYNERAAQDQARRIAAERLFMGRAAYVEVIIDQPGNVLHGQPVYWVETETGST